MKWGMFISATVILIIHASGCRSEIVTPDATSSEAIVTESSVDIITEIPEDLITDTLEHDRQPKEVDSSSSHVSQPLSVLPTIRAISLNIYAHVTMPSAADVYARYINELDVDVVGIQEGVNDWKIGPGLPTDYWAANSLGLALGPCWEQRYQIFINTCRGNNFVSHRRFDLTDGPNATRTGESAVIGKNATQYLFITVHWDHELSTARAASSLETAAEVNSFDLPTIVVGDFNTACHSNDPVSMAELASLDLAHNAGIDCVFQKGWGSQIGDTFVASPSDHPGIWVELMKD